MPEVEGLMIKEAGQERYSFHPGTNVPYPPEADVEVRLAGPATNLSGIAVKSAPAELSLPQIIGDGRIGDTFTRQSAGSASGSPTPEKGSPIWARRASGQSTWVVIDGASGETYTAGDDLFDEGDDLRSGTPFTNSEGSIILWSLPIKISAAPQITASIDLQPAGQQSSITFNVAIDGSPTIAQGSTSIAATRVGTTNQWTFVAPIEGPISFAATKAGYTAFSDATRTVAPALSALIERDYEIMLQGDPGSEPVIFDEPQEYAAPYVTPNSSLVNGMAVLAEAVISRTGDVITTTRDPLFTWDDSIEPISYGHAYYRGTTALNATLIEGTEGAISYTVDPALDGGKNVYRRDWLEGAGSDSELAVFSNGIAVAAVSNWWNPLVDAHPGSVEIDWATGRIRRTGVSYPSLAEARTAGVLKTNASGVDYLDVSGLGNSVGVAATGITPSADGNYSMLAMDDGDDGVPTDEYIALGVTTPTRASFAIISGGTTLFNPSSTATTPLNTPVRLAMRAKASNVINSIIASVNGVSVGSGQTSGGMPAVTRLCVGNRSTNDRNWTAGGGSLSRLILINADLTNAQINDLLA